VEQRRLLFHGGQLLTGLWVMVLANRASSDGFSFCAPLRPEQVVLS
jgi:hypothetical protein